MRLGLPWRHTWMLGTPAKRTVPSFPWGNQGVKGYFRARVIIRAVGTISRGQEPSGLRLSTTGKVWVSKPQLASLRYSLPPPGTVLLLKSPPAGTGRRGTRTRGAVLGIGNWLVATKRP